MNSTKTKEKNIQSANEATLLSASDCARMCRISRRSWFRLSASAKCPACVRVGASPRWVREDLLDWIRWGCPSLQEFQARKEAEQC